MPNPYSTTDPQPRRTTPRESFGDTGSSFERTATSLSSESTTTCPSYKGTTTCPPYKGTTTCPYCGVGCGVVATIEDGTLIDVAGDPAHPANQGRLCVKGSALHETLGERGRLSHPVVDGEAVGWDEALQCVASRLASTQREHGRESVAAYLSGQLLTEDYYVANKLFKGFLGSPHLDTNSRLCMASAVAGYKRAFGADAVPCSYEDLEEAELVVLVGSNLAWNHPVLYQRLKVAKERNPLMRVVVIDPGHGGIDPGTTGVTGRLEKRITLAVAKEVARQLGATGRYHVVLTRERDEFIRLRDRVARARAAGGELFISLHADSIENGAIRGASVYTLSQTSSDAQAAALAAKENRADLIAGLDLDGESDEVATILIDLAQRETMNLSAGFANLLVPQIREVGRILRDGHRFAGFAVLKAPDVPSVLVEMGYLSNRRDERQLASPAFQVKIAGAIVRGTDRYFAELRE